MRIPLTAPHLAPAPRPCPADNLRGVLHALESNFQVAPSEDDKALLEDVGFPYGDFDTENAVDENDPVHVRATGPAARRHPARGRPFACRPALRSSEPRAGVGPAPGNPCPSPFPPQSKIKKKLGVTGEAPPPGQGDGGQGATPWEQGDGEVGVKRKGHLNRLTRKYDDEEEEGQEEGAAGQGRGKGGAGAQDPHGAQDEEEEEEEEEADPREAELERIRALKNPYIRGVKLFEAGAIPEAVDWLCTQDRIRIAPKAKEIAAGKPAFKTVARAAAALKVCGVAVLDRALPRPVVAALAARVAALAGARMASVDVGADAKPTFEGVETAKRSQGRYEFANPLEAPFTDAAVLENAFVMPVLRRAMGARLEVDTFSTVVSEPGSPTQHWHADAGQLFPRSGMHLPAHGVVVFAAVTNVTRDMGPTEFAPGSHVQCGKAEKPRPVHYDDGSVLDLCRAVPGNRLLHADMAAGAVTLFDFRIYHRGGANSAELQRPLLYSTYLREWYTDKVNFHQQHSAAFDALSPSQRKLLNRIDHKKHVATVQEQVRALGGTVAESRYDFHVYTYDSKDLAPPSPAQ